MVIKKYVKTDQNVKHVSYWSKLNEEKTIVECGLQLKKANEGLCIYF